MSENRYRKRFESENGKVVYISVETISEAYPENTFKVEAKIYPIGSGSYSSFIYTTQDLETIISEIEKIGPVLVEQHIIGTKEISDLISQYLVPIFPMRYS